jgi:probable HAF family extracellular repeat protein
MKNAKSWTTHRSGPSARVGLRLVALNLCALGLLLPSSNGSAEVRYRVVQLMTNEQVGAVTCWTAGINRFGDVAGTYAVERGTNAYPYEWVPFVYRDATGMVPLVGPETLNSAAASGINDHGQVALWGSSGDGLLLAYRYTPGVGLEPLGSIGDGSYDQTTGINNLGQVVGRSDASNGNQSWEYGFLYTDGKGVTNIGSIDEGAYSAAYDINDLGQVTGNSGGYIFIYTRQAGMVPIGEGLAHAINNLEMVVGEVPDIDGWYRAALYVDGATRFLTPPGMDAVAYGINDHNVVVGQRTSVGDSPRTFVWTERDGLMWLNDFIEPGWILTYPSGINENGQIACEGGIPGKTSGTFRLDPIPPKLGINHSPTNLVVSWSPNWPGLALEATESLSRPNWQPVVTGGTNVVAMPATNSMRFFRLNLEGIRGLCCAPE